MAALRKRIPFKVVEDEEEEETRVLDEEEQEALIEDIKSANAAVRERHVLALATILCLSVVLQFLSFFQNPLLNIFPLNDGPYKDIPIPAIFTLVSLCIHANMALIGSREDLLAWHRHPSHLQPLSYRITYSLAGVAPALAVLLQRPFQSLLWWCMTPVVVLTAQTIIASSKEGIQSITELESLKYRALGA